MPKRGKNYLDNIAKVDRLQTYQPKEAIDLVTYLLSDECVSVVIFDELLMGLSVGIADINFELDHSFSLL